MWMSDKQEMWQKVDWHDVDLRLLVDVCFRMMENSQLFLISRHRIWLIVIISSTCIDMIAGCACAEDQFHVLFLSWHKLQHNYEHAVTDHQWHDSYGSI